MMLVNHRGYKIQQLKNNHIRIMRDNETDIYYRLAYKQDEDTLKELVDYLIEKKILEEK